jgi:hypothetical protein
LADRLASSRIRIPSRKVTIVVVVLMTSCQVSLKLKIGPDAIHARIRRTASMNTCQEPAIRVIRWAR